jgi:hypothetical protein
MVLGVVLGSFLTLSAATARADVASPGDQFCTLTYQCSDGKECYYSFRDPAENAAGENCAKDLLAQGYTERCGVGGTVHRVIYCPPGAMTLPTKVIGATSMALIPAVALFFWRRGKKQKPSTPPPTTTTTTT